MKVRPVTGTVLAVERFSLHNGPGIRSTLFVKGCPLRCLWCANPESQAFEPELSYNRELCMVECAECLHHCPSGMATKGADGRVDLQWAQRPAGGKEIGACTRVCPSGALSAAGRVLTAQEAVHELLADRPFYQESGGGVTISGGEPLAQPDFTAEVLRLVREAGVHTALDTAGYAEPADLDRVAQQADLVLFDLKAADEDAHQRWTGRPLAPIVENLRRLLAARRALPNSVRLRIPLVASLNGTAEHLAELADLLRSLGVSEVDLLPYHRLGAAKYAQIGMEYPLPHEVPPNAASLAGVVERLRAAGVAARVVA